ncbi:MAG: ABC transporter permease [Gammaproteobacteria bacterium]|mgnify:FL=1|jgi:tungstate transport system permease protein|nr:ABC transporter permease [Gammaproteobacteria bacterium]MBT6755446.1 ABC transporter permease [Gammaproteobacteria bacterium]MBT7523029.1 ABC transporter permease [Gammaproteobacteria bacterium]MBT7814898.1 ABC transporter permease [Gammaproteobacteria bacterium]MDA9896315.1 ABC transporter permease [Gammaproteobacteria bacterium]|tara:strand:- start:3120 stop:3803 length:684 start_codon:yes stop_codon:yes gene_type:complete
MLINILETAFNLIISLNKDLFEIISLSLKVTISALIIAVSISIPIGAFLALYKNKFQSFLVLISNTLMGMPPVVLGLLIYTLVSKKGIFGFLDILYTPSAMILAQTLLIIPIVISLTYEEIYKKNKEYNLLLISLNLSNFSKLKTLIYECRYALLTVALTGFGRASAEVGAVMIVGGNINHFTRVMTTAIAFETSKGSIELAVALGLILLLISLIITIIIKSLRKIS